MKYAARRGQHRRRQWTALASCRSGLILSLALAACANLSPPGAVMGSSPETNGVAPTPSLAAATAPGGKSRREQDTAAREAAPPARAAREVSDPGKEALPPRDQLSSIYFSLGSYSFDRDAKAVCDRLMAVQLPVRKPIARPLHLREPVAMSAGCEDE